MADVNAINKLRPLGGLSKSPKRRSHMGLERLLLDG